MCSQTSAFPGMDCHCPLIRVINQKRANEEHLTVAPVAVREVLENGLSGSFKEVARSWEITEYSPRHTVSMAQIVADAAGGGAVVPGGHGKPMNLGGGTKSGVASTLEMHMCRSGSLVTEDSESKNGRTASATLRASEEAEAESGETRESRNGHKTTAAMAAQETSL